MMQIKARIPSKTMLKPAADQSDVVRLIEGGHVRFPERMIPLVDLILDRAPAEAVAAEMIRVSNAGALSVNDVLRILNDVFGSMDLSVRLSGEPAHQVFVFKRIGSKNSQAESLIKVKVTLVPGHVVDRIASLFSPAFGTLASISILVAIVASLLLYAAVFGAGALGVGYVMQNEQSLTSSGSVVLIGIMLFSFVFHEFGHSSASARFGRKVRRIGFGIYWIFPALFSDVSASWTLKRRHRLAIDAGGVYFQAIVCGVLALAAVALDGVLPIAALQIALVLNLLSMASSMNPMLKFDGYWIFSDWFGIPNLRQRSDDALASIAKAWARPAGHGSEGARIRPALRVYAVLSLLYGFVFAAYLLYVITDAFGYMTNIPASTMLEAHTSLTNHDYLRLFSVALESLGRVIPFVVAPIALVSAFSGVVGFVRRFANQEA